MVKRSNFILLFVGVIFVFSLFFVTYNLKSSYAMTAGGDTPILKSFSIDNNILTKDDVLSVNMNYDFTSSEGINYYAMWLTNVEAGNYLYVTSKTGEFDLKNSYMDTNAVFIPGEYTIDQLIVFPNSEIDSRALYYNTKVYGQDYPSSLEEKWVNMPYEFPTITINDSTINNSSNDQNTTRVFADYVMNLTDKKAAVGEKINLSITKVVNDSEFIKNDLESMLLSFTNSTDGSVLNVYVKSLAESPHFIIPSTATIGNYNLNYMALKNKEGQLFYYTGNDGKGLFAYESQFEVVAKDVKDSSKDKYTYVFDNSNYNTEVKQNIEELESNAIITVNANNNSIISKELFEKIKDTKRTLLIEYANTEWVFSGRDIVNPKTIDVSTTIKELSSSDYYNNLLKANVPTDSLSLKFADNGELPGKVLIKLEASSLDKVIDTNELYVYYYQKDKDNLLKVAMEIQKNDGFYEFYISHNSDYILAKNEIKSTSISNEKDMLQLNSTSEVNHSSYLWYVLGFSALAVLVITFVIVLIRLFKKKKS